MLLSPFGNSQQHFSLLSHHLNTTRMVLADAHWWTATPLAHIIWAKLVSDVTGCYQPQNLTGVAVCDPQSFIWVRDPYNILLAGYHVDQSPVLQSIWAMEPIMSSTRVVQLMYHASNRLVSSPNPT